MGTTHTTPLEAVVDPNELEKAVAAKLVRKQVDSSGTLAIYTYTPEAQYSGSWTRATRVARGLIVDQDGNVRARPFEKFFNYGERDQVGEIPDISFVIADKMDGSLGIAYQDANGNTAIATKGSFASEQAKGATRILAERWPEWTPENGSTYLFEYIAPDNRIVVDYGDKLDLILLAIIDIETGADLELPGNWPGEVVASHHGVEAVEAVVAMMTQDEISGLAREGYVLRFDGDGTQPNLRIKIKYPDYVRLHRIVTGVNARTIWEMVVARELAGLSEDDQIRALRTSKENALEIMACSWEASIGQLPDEIYEWADQVDQDLMLTYKAEMHKCLQVVQEGAEMATRKERAILYQNSGVNIGVAFALTDGQNDRARRELWRTLRPAADKYSNTTSDETPT